MTRSNPLPYLTLIVLSIWLTACGKPKAQAMLEDYAYRMSNVLDTPIEHDFPLALKTLPSLPAKRERALNTPDIRAGMLEVWDFEQCGMMHLIAERNSSLGKVMLPSQKMRYELRLMAALQKCRAQLLKQGTLNTEQQAFFLRLQNIAELKQQNLGREVWNGIYHSDEISQHFALGQPPLTSETGQSGNAQRALERLHTIAGLISQKTLTLPGWLDDIEAIYYDLYSSQFGANLLPALIMLTETLDKTADAIEQRLQRSPFCYKGHRPRRAEILRNIFQKYYAGQVQPYMAIVQREGQEWLRLHDRIMRKLPAPEAMQLYQQQVISLTAPESLWRKWEAANQRHTQAWQDILGQCEMMPGQQ